MRELSNAGDRVPGSDELPSDQAPECAGGVGNQDVHLGSPPQPSALNNRQVGIGYATVTQDRRR